MLILLTAFHTLHIFWLSLTDFQNFPGPVAFFQDFTVLENAIIKFQDFPGFPGPIRTLSVIYIDFSFLNLVCIYIFFESVLVWAHKALNKCYTGMSQNEIKLCNPHT